MKGFHLKLEHDEFWLVAQVAASMYVQIQQE